MNGAAVGAGMNLALGCDVRLAARRAQVRHPLPADRPAPRWRAHVDAAAHRRPAGGDGRGACSARSSTAPRPSASGSSIAASTTTPCCRRPRRWRRAPRRRRASWRSRTKETIQAMADIDDHPAAVERELEPQLWSTQQPWFAERIAALQAKISPKQVDARRQVAHDCYHRVFAPLGCRSTVRARTRLTRHRTSRRVQREVLDEPAPSRSTEVLPPPKMELRAHAHNERHRIHGELHAVANQVSRGSRTRRGARAGQRRGSRSHHHDAEVAREKVAKSSRAKRHWKMKMWKRRSPLRQAKAEAIRLAGEQADRHNQAGGELVAALRPLLDGDAVAHVVLPRAVDLEEALGDALLADRQHLHHPAAVGLRGTMQISRRWRWSSSKANAASTTTPSAM